jgi:hypothetical protein
MIQKMKSGERQSVFGASASTLGGTCPECGKLYALVGRVHNCVPVKSTKSDVGDVGTPDSTSTTKMVCEPVASPAQPRVKFDRNMYQRNYMREYMKKYLPKYRRRKRDAKASGGG